MRFSVSFLLLSFISSFGALTQEEYNLLYDIESNTDGTVSRLSEIQYDITDIVGYLNGQYQYIVDIDGDLDSILSKLESIRSESATIRGDVKNIRANVGAISRVTQDYLPYLPAIQDDTAETRTNIRTLLEYIWSVVQTSSNMVTTLRQVSNTSSNTLSTLTDSYSDIHSLAENFVTYSEQNINLVSNLVQYSANSSSSTSNSLDRINDTLIQIYSNIVTQASSSSNAPVSSLPFALTNFVAVWNSLNDWEHMYNQDQSANHGFNSIWEALSTLATAMQPFDGWDGSGDLSQPSLFPPWVLARASGASGGTYGSVTPSQSFGSGLMMWPEMQQLQFYYMVSNTPLFESYRSRRTLPTGAERKQWVNLWGDYNYFTGLPLGGQSQRTNKEYLFSDWLADFLKMSAATNHLENVEDRRYYEALSNSASNILDNVSTNGWDEPLDIFTNDLESIQPFEPPTLWEIPAWSDDPNSAQGKLGIFTDRWKGFVNGQFGSVDVESNTASVNLRIIPALTQFNISEGVFNFSENLPKIANIVHVVLGMCWSYLAFMYGVHIIVDGIRSISKAC